MSAAWQPTLDFEAADQAAEQGEALIVDLDGSVLESGHGNVFVVEDGALLTPPADGRILPGVTRAGLLARAQEERITLDRLRAADEVFLTSSIRLRQPAALASERDRPLVGQS